LSDCSLSLLVRSEMVYFRVLRVIFSKFLNSRKMKATLSLRISGVLETSLNCLLRSAFLRS
jgi:hypothetical protein